MEHVDATSLTHNVKTENPLCRSASLQYVVTKRSTKEEPNQVRSLLVEESTRKVSYPKEYKLIDLSIVYSKALVSPLGDAPRARVRNLE